MQYEQDYDDALPTTGTPGTVSPSWRSAVYPYIKSRNVFECPSRRGQDPGPDGFATSYAANDSGVYGHPPGFQGLGAFSPPGSKPLKTTDFPEPSRLVAVCEITGTSRYDFDAGDPTIPGSGKEQIWAGHKGKSNFLLMDGHAKSLDPPETLGYTDPAADKPGGAVPRNLWYRDPSHPVSPEELVNVSNVVRE